MTKRAFGELELQIVNLLRSGKRLTVKEVQALLGGDDKYTTIMTVMNRLAEKKQLARERKGLQYEYWLHQAPSFMQQIKKKILGLKTSEVVSYLIESGDDITDQDLLEIEKLIHNAKEKRKQG
jgi:predicted transcriptional regulator